MLTQHNQPGKIPHNFSQGLTNNLAEQRHQHSLLAKALHWFFVILFGYGVYKQIENKEQLNDLELLKSEIFFALIFLIFILFRLIYMKIYSANSSADHVNFNF